MRIKAILIILLQLLFTQIFAQTEGRIGIPNIRNYPTKIIEAGAQTWSIDIAPNGFTYFANNDGVLEFDGIHWRNYPIPGNSIVRCVKATMDERIYAGGFNEFGYFQSNENGIIKYNSLMPLLDQKYSDFGEMWRIYELPIGIVFQSYDHIIIYKDEAVKVIEAPSLFHFSFLANGEIYVNDQKNGLYRLANTRLVKLTGVSELKGMLISTILPHKNGLLIATSDEKIYLFNGIKLSPWKTEASAMLQQNQVYTGLLLKDETYVFGTIQDGLVFCNSSGKILQHINLNKGLQNSTVLSLQIDQHENLWVGLDNGIDYIEINSPISYLSESNNLSTGYDAILFDDILYLGTNRGLFYHDWKSLQNGSGIQRFTLIPNTQGQIWSLKEIDGKLFCGHTSGIFIIEKSRAKRIADIQGGWTFIQPEDNKNIILVGTYTGLVKLEKRFGRWTFVKQLKGFDESSRTIEYRKPGELWMTHGYKGIFNIKLNDNYDSVIDIKFYNDSTGLPTSKNIKVTKINGKIVFPTGYGLYTYDETNDKFIRDIQQNKNFSSTGIRDLLEDNYGNVWYFTQNETGVFRLQEDGTYVNVSIPFKELKDRFIDWFQFVYPINEDHIIFGLENGFALYNANKSKDYRKPFQAYIRKVTLMSNDSVIYGGGRPNNILFKEVFYRDNQLKFEFAANDNENPGSILFSTKLVVFDDKWSEWNSRTIREFTNLRSGYYTFSVKAKNIFEQESTIHSFIFEVHPPWFLNWQGLIVYIGILILFVLMLIRYIRYKTAKSKREEKERQKRKFMEREKELQTSALRAEKEMVKMRNDKLRAEMKQRDKELANTTMEMIQKGKLLNSIKNSLMKVSEEINDDLISRRIKQINRKIDREMDTEQHWAVFDKHFNKVHEEFLKRLKETYPDLTPKEMKLCAFLRLNISSKEIATLMNISTRGVEISRYRLRKKLQLDTKTNLSEFILSF